MPSELVTVQQVRGRLLRSANDLRVAGLRVYHDQSASATACTVQVTATALVLVITGGANAGTYTYTLASAAQDTMAELVSVLNAAGRGFVASLDTFDSAASSDLQIASATSCFGSGAEQTLYITDNYALREIVRGVSDAVEKTCKRTFASASYTSWLNGTGSRFLWLPNPPVSISRVSSEPIAGLRIKNTSTTHTSATVQVTSSAIVLRWAASDGTSGSSSTSTASAILSALATSIAAVGSGWTAEAVTAVANVSGALLRPISGKNALGVFVDCEVPGAPIDDYEVNTESGQIQLTGGDVFPGGYGNVYVAYTGGYTTIDYGLQMLVAGLCAEVYNVCRTGEGVAQGSLGDMSYSRGGTDNAIGAVMTRPDVIQQLSPWMRREVA